MIFRKKTKDNYKNMENLLFDFAEQNEEGEVIDLIEKEGVNINAKDDEGYNLLMVSLFRGLKMLALYLIGRGIDLNHQDNKGQTILHHLAVFYDEEVLIKCLEKGVDIDIQDNYGNQPLWAAVFNDDGYGNKRLTMIQALLGQGANPNHLNNAGRSPLIFAENAEYDESILKMLRSKNDDLL